MHIFFVDLKISIDMLSPIINNLINNNQKVIMYNINLIQDYNRENNMLLRFLSKNPNFKFISDYDISLRSRFFKFFFSLFRLYFNKGYYSGYRLWSFLWKETFYLSKNKFKYFIKKNNVKSLTIVEDLPAKKKLLLNRIKNELNIPLIMAHGGINTIPSTTKFSEITPNYYLAANNQGKELISSLKSFKLFGSPRYSKKWINSIEQIYLLEEKKNKKLFTIGVFMNQNSPLLDGMKELVAKIKSTEIKVLINSKPREIVPLSQSFQNNEISASELIHMSDLIISYPSSILLEAVQKEKPIIFPCFLEKFNELNKGNVFENNDMFLFPKNINELIELIEKYRLRDTKHKYDEKQKKIFLEKMIQDELTIDQKYLNFYLTLN
tara:strand:- start:18956 stop:20095 length:1140 start_codon:yes stop_codon:yes gene_type:complete